MFTTSNDPYDLVSKQDVAVSRPALERAGFLCEGCKRDDGLRVASGRGRFAGQLVVLCPECRICSGFEFVIARRRAKLRAGGELL